MPEIEYAVVLCFEGAEQTGNYVRGYVESGRLKPLNRRAEIDITALMRFQENPKSPDDLQAATFGFASPQQLIDNQLLRSQFFGESDRRSFSSIKVTGAALFCRC